MTERKQTSAGMMDLRHGLPYSLIRFGVPYDYPKLTKNITTDVVVIGSGISGALSAYYLHKAGISCVVVDARTVATGSTCASTSLIQYELDATLHELKGKLGQRNAAQVYKLSHGAIDDLECIAHEIQFLDFHRHSSVFYAQKAGDVKNLYAEFEGRKALGFAVKWCEERAMFNKFGLNKKAGILSAQAASIDAYRFTHALHQYNISKGCEVFDRTKVTGTTYKRAGVVLTTANGHFIKSRWVINATGYEAERLVGKKHVKLLSTFAVASEQMLSEELKQLGNAIYWSTGTPYHYFRKTTDNRLIIGGRDEPFFNPSARDRLLRKKSVQLVKDFNRLYPEINFIPEFSWTGTFGVTPDSLPYIGKHPQFPHTLFALGFGGNGIVFSVIAARMNAQTLCGTTPAAQPLFTFSRF